MLAILVIGAILLMIVMSAMQMLTFSDKTFQNSLAQFRMETGIRTTINVLAGRGINCASVGIGTTVETAMMKISVKTCSLLPPTLAAADPLEMAFNNSDNILSYVDHNEIVPHSEADCDPLPPSAPPHQPSRKCVPLIQYVLGIGKSALKSGFPPDFQPPEEIAFYAYSVPTTPTTKAQVYVVRIDFPWLQ